MARRTGIANLPLHGGRAPRWLFERMARLAPAVIEVIVLEHGPDEVLRRLSDPFWFQAFGCVLGFDWHSSGVTTVVCGALKTGLAGRETDLGLWVTGGKGRASRHTPGELERNASALGLDPARLAYTSRITAKVDSAAVQDGFGIYHHTFLHTAAGRWAVIQQGMRDGDAAARRYHWLGEQARDFTDEPHAAIASDSRDGAILNLVAHESAGARAAIAELAREEPGRVAREARKIGGGASARASASARVSAGASARASARARVSAGAGANPGAGARANGDAGAQLGLFDAGDGGGVARRPPRLLVEAGEPARLRMPARHPVDIREDLDPKRLESILVRTYEAAPADFEAVLAVPGIGARSVRALALLAELVHGTPASVRDPARFSFAHGGKDGHPYPVDRPVYDHTVEWLRETVARAKMGDAERTRALRRLASFAAGSAGA